MTTLTEFLIDAAEKKFSDEEEESGIPPRLEPVEVLKRVRDLLSKDVDDLTYLDINDLVQDVEDSLHYFEEPVHGSFRPKGFKPYVGPLREDGGAGHVGRAPDALPDDAAGGSGEEDRGDAEEEGGAEDPDIPF